MTEPFELSSAEVVFKDVVVHAAAARTLSLTNNSGARLELTVRAPCADKVEVQPSRCALLPGETATFVVKLRVGRLPAGRRRVDAVYKEYIFFKTEFIEKRVAISYSLAAEQPSASGKAGAVSRSMEDLRDAAAAQEKAASGGRLAGNGQQLVMMMKESRSNVSQEAEQNSAAVLQLQSELQAVQYELQSAKTEAAFAEAVREELQAAFPDVNRLANLVMERERAENEARDARVLALLKSKDERILSLEGSVSVAREELQSMQSNYHLLQTKLSNSERERESLSAQVSELASLPSQLSQSQKQVAALESRVQDMEPSVRKAASAQRELRELASEIERFRARAAELEESHRGVLGEHQRATAANLELSRRAVVAEEQVDRLVRELGSSKSGSASHNVAAYIARITELENTNSILESSLQKLRQTLDRQQSAGSATRSDVSMSFEAATNEALKQRIVKLQRQLFQSHAHCVAVASKTLSLKTASQLREAISNSWTDVDEGIVDTSPSNSLNTNGGEKEIQSIRQVATLESQPVHIPSVAVQHVQTNDLTAKIASLEVQLSESKRKLRDSASRYEKELKVAVDSSIEAKRCASLLYEKVAELLGPYEASRLSDKLNLFNSSADNFLCQQRSTFASQTGEGLLRRTELELSTCRNRVRELEHTLSEAQRAFEEKLRDAEEQIHDSTRAALAQKEAAATRIQELEDVVRRVGSKNDLHRRLSSALMECAQLRASDTRHWSEVNSLRERVSMYKADSAAMRRAIESMKARLSSSGNSDESSSATISADEVSSLRGTVDAQAREISRLEELLRSAKIEFDRLHVVEEAAADGAAAAIRVRMLERDHDQLKAALSSREFQVKVLEAEILRGRNSNKHLKEQLTISLQSLANAESRSLESQFISTEQAAASDMEVQRELISCRNRIGELEHELHIVSSQLETANSSLSHLNSDMLQSQAKYEENRTYLEKVLRENERLSQAAALQSMRADHESEKLMSSLSESQSKLALLQQTVSAMQCEDDVKSHAAALALQLSAAMSLEGILQSQLQEAALALQECKSKSSLSRSMEADLQAELQIEREKSASAEKRCSILASQIEMLQRHVEDFEQQQHNNSSTIMMLNVDVDRLRAECNALRRSLEEESQCHRRDVASLHSSFTKDLNSLAIRMSSKLPPTLEATTKAWQLFAGAISDATSTIQSEMPSCGDHLASIFKAINEIEIAFQELHRTSFATELRCSVAESRNLSEIIARAEYQRNATYYQERLKETMQQLESITSDLSLLERNRSKTLSSKVKRLLELVLSKDPALHNETREAATKSASNANEVCEQLSAAIQKLEGSLQVSEAPASDVDYVLARFSQAISLLWTCQTELSQVLCEPKGSVDVVVAASDQDKQRLHERACALVVAETRLELAQQLAAEEVRKREILQSEISRLRELVRSIENSRIEESRLIQDEARQSIDAIRRDLELVVSTARRHVFQAESALAESEQEMVGMVHRSITVEVGIQCKEWDEPNEFILKCSTLQDQLHEVVAELEDKKLLILTLQEDVAARDASLHDLRKVIESAHVKDGKSKAVAASLAKELVDARIAVTISQRRASKVEKSLGNSAAPALAPVEDSVNVAKSQSVNQDASVSILLAALDIRAAVSVACKAVAGQYSSGTVQNHNARALVKKLDAASISQEMRTLSQLLRQDLQTFCQVIGVEFVRTEPLGSSNGNLISDNAQLIVNTDECICWLRKQLNEQTLSLKMNQSEPIVKQESSAHQKGDESKGSSRASLSAKISKTNPEFLAKTVDELKSNIARLKAELADREKECNSVLSRAIDAEATCDQLRSELGKVLQVKNTSARRSVDSSICSGINSSLDVSQSLPLLLDGDDTQALKHKVLELQRDNSNLRVANAKLGRRMTVALASVTLSEKQTLLPDENDISYSAEEALLAHHQSEIAAAEAAVTISSLKREVKELQIKNSQLQHQADSTGSTVSDIEGALRDATSRLSEYQSLYLDSDRRNQEMLVQLSAEQSRCRQLEDVMVGLQREIAESRDRNHALEELVRQLRSALDDATSEYNRSLQIPSHELEDAHAQIRHLNQQLLTIQTELASLQLSILPSSAIACNDNSIAAQIAALRDYLERLEAGVAQREQSLKNLESQLESTKKRLLDQERKAEAIASQREEEQRDYEYQMNSMRRRLAAAVSSRNSSVELQSNRAGNISNVGSSSAKDKRVSSARSSPKKKPKSRSKSASASAHVSASDCDSDDVDKIDAVSELREAKRRLRAIKFDRDLVKDERDVLQLKLHASEQEISAALSKAKQTQKELMEYRSSVKVAEQRCHNMEEQLKVAKLVAAETEELRAAAASFESALKAARDDASKKSRQYRELAAEKKSTDEQCADLQQQFKSLKERVKQLQSHNARLQERIVTLTAEAESNAASNAALAANQTSTIRPTSAPSGRSPSEVHVAKTSDKPRSKSPHVVAPASLGAPAPQSKSKPADADAKKDALVRSLQLAAQQQESLVVTLREELDRKEKAVATLRKARADLERRVDSNAAAHSQLLQARADHDNSTRERDAALSKAAKLQKELVVLSQRLEHSEKQATALTSIIQFVAEKMLLGVEESLGRMHSAAQAAADSAGDNASLGGLDMRAVARQLVASKSDVRSSVQNSMGSLAAGLKIPVDVSGVQQMLVTWLEQRVSLAGSVDSSQDDSITGRQGGSGQGLIEDVMRMHKELFA